MKPCVSKYSKNITQPNEIATRVLFAAFWLFAAVGLTLPRAARAAGPTDWTESRRSGEITSTALLRTAGADGRSSPVSTAAVTLPAGYSYCRHQFDYHGWVGRGIATVTSAAPGRMAFGISVHGGDGPLDQGQGTIVVTVTGMADNGDRRSCTALPVIGDDVSVTLRPWVFDEHENREIPGVSALPDAAFGAEPGHPDRVNGVWHGGYHWEGNRLCLEIRHLAAPAPSVRLFSIGYAVSMKGARFSDGDTDKTLKLYTYLGTPEQTEITECFPVRR